jgi:hypothetical protein
MQVVFFLNKLHDNVARDEYEKWVSEVDYPTARSIPSIVDYRVYRIDGPLEGDAPAPYQYIERVVIRNAETYLRDLQDERLDDFKRAWGSYVAASTAVRGTLIE